MIILIIIVDLNCTYLFYAVADSQLRFLYKPQNKSAFYDSKVYLLCVAAGRVSSYVWLKDGANINNSGIEYKLTAGDSVLHFRNITDQTSGVYTCVVKGEANQTIHSTAWFQTLGKFKILYKMYFQEFIFVLHMH